MVLSFLNESNSKAVDVGDCAVPDKGVVEVPVEVLGVATVNTSVGGRCSGEVGRHVVVVVVPLHARGDVELIGESKGKVDLHVED